jgi:hypothetical protein
MVTPTSQRRATLQKLKPQTPLGESKNQRDFRGDLARGIVLMTHSAATQCSISLVDSRFYIQQFLEKRFILVKKMNS